MTEFETEFRDRLLRHLNLQDIDPETITRDTVFFGSGLGLDSIDAIEIVILIEKEYGIVLSVAERNQTIFKDLGVLCDFLRENRNRDKKDPK